MFQAPLDDSLNSLETLPIDNSEPEYANTIIQQPTRNDDYPGTRRPIPISTIEWQSTSDMHFIPSEGIDFLRGVEQLNIQQTVELTTLSTSSFLQSVNRYKVVVPQGETLYYAMENSTDSQRMFCGSNREFMMRLYDHSQQEALILKRRLGCGICALPCYLHLMEVWMSDTEYLGKIKQNFAIGVPSFSVINDHDNTVYRIEGPGSWGCGTIKEAHFKIYSPDGLTQLGSINHHWDPIKSDYNLGLHFPNRRDHPKNKALLIGASFLLEYMYFVNAKRSGGCAFC